MDRVALLIDAGNLIAAGGNLCVGSGRRHELAITHHGLLNALTEMVHEHAGLPLLRTYWYDAVRDNVLTAEHRAIRDHPYTKVRFGRLDRGVQKGVDALLFRDMTALARTRAVSSIYLVAGDEDLREAVAEAQDYGVQVVLMAVEPAGNSRVSDALTWEADAVIDLDQDTLSPYFSLRTEQQSED